MSKFQTISQSIKHREIDTNEFSLSTKKKKKKKKPKLRKHTLEVFCLVNLITLARLANLLAKTVSALGQDGGHIKALVGANALCLKSLFILLATNSVFVHFASRDKSIDGLADGSASLRYLLDVHGAVGLDSQQEWRNSHDDGANVHC